MEQSAKLSEDWKLSAGQPIHLSTQELLTLLRTLNLLSGDLAGSNLLMA